MTQPTQPQKRKTFNQYLQEVFCDEYHGHEDYFEDAYEAWLEQLEGSDYEQLANDFADEVEAAAEKRCREEMEKVAVALRGGKVDMEGEKYRMWNSALEQAAHKLDLLIHNTHHQ